ncbi:MAG: helix-turn-helix domain-containing protein [Pseudomonadota bacterium]
MSDTQTGSRIREKRVIAGMKQADLAERSGISPSYLNLIEHNRRRIGGKVLLSIAAALEVEPQTLSEGAEQGLIAALREAAHAAGHAVETAERADEFANRFPGWAEVLSQTRKRVTALEQTVEALSDRLSHDPHLAASMHELLTTAAAIRSTAAILAETETLQPEWRNRFHANIHEDSRRLSDSAQSLVGYLDADDKGAEADASPQEEVEAFLTAHNFRFEALEGAGPYGVEIDRLVAEAPELHTAAAKHIAKGALLQVSADAARLSVSQLRQAVARVGSDPLALTRALDQPAAVILRRMAALPELQCGLVVCDRSGTVLFRKSVEGFNVPRSGACCPLWPLFSALGQPGALIAERIGQLGRTDYEFMSYATAEVVAAPASYNMPPLVQAVMLQLLAPPGSGEVVRAVGSTCRVCPQESCAARREPSILAAGI